MTSSLADIARRIVDWDGITKSPGIYDIYDRYFADLAGRPVTIMELGVHRGESTKVFATYFAKGRVIGVDLDPKPDLSAYPNVELVRAGQSDAAELQQVCRRLAPDGLDVVIDDASHIAVNSIASYRILLPLLKPGGLYIVEDWLTGYWNDWPDGHEVQPPGPPVFQQGLQARFPSHDYGLVGFLKSLFEDVCPDIAPVRGAPIVRQAPLEFMHLYGHVAVLKKRADVPGNP